MQQVISNFEIKRVFNDFNNEYLNDNFLGVYPSNKINKFIDFNRMMKGRKYPFFIANTGRSDKAGRHRWSILDMSPTRNFLLLDTFGIDGLKNFIT